MTQGESSAHTIRPKASPTRGGAMSTVRILAIAYVAQAGVGIVLGCAYAVWLVYG